MRRAFRSVPKKIVRPPYAESGIVEPPENVIVLHRRPEEVQALRKAARLARRVLDLACSLAKPGVTTNEIDAQVHEAICAEGAYPAPLNYRGFPRSVCSSVNNEVCHGIPSDRPLVSGDIAKFDASVYTPEGFFGDNCGTVIVGEGDADAVRLDATCKRALDEAIRAIGPGVCLSKIGEIIEDVVTAEGFESVTAYCGHGIGRGFHMLPFVQHVKNDTKLPLREGMTFTIEPMITEGKQETYVSKEDNWTVCTIDGSRAAQYEHMILITKDGVEVLTDSEEFPEFS